ncbi:MAG: peptidoglycan recognition family protein [Phycisphaerales bacterium JB059]
MNRRDAVKLVIRTGAATLGAGALTGALAGCASSKRRSGVHIGEPIPADPSIARAPTRVEPWIAPAPAPTATPETLPTTPPPSISGVISRSHWAKGAPRPWLADPMDGIRRITVHHDGMSPFTSSTWGSAARRIEAIRNAHTGKGWADIGYHYVIDPAGRIWQARPLELQGAHVKSANPHNLGICVLGNFERQRPTRAAMTSLENLIASEMRRLRVPLSEVRTHQEFAPTACPGRSLQAMMNASRSRGGRLRRA